MNDTKPLNYGAYAYLEKEWTLQELTDAEAALVGLEGSQGYRVLQRLLEEREKKTIDRLIHTPQLDVVQMEGLRSMVNGLRQVESAIAGVREAVRRRTAALEQRGVDGGES